MKTTILALFTICIILSSCKKDSGSSSSTWHVKYEVTSNDPKAVLSIIFRDQAGSVKQIGSSDPSTHVNLPWTYEADWSKDPGLLAARTLTITIGSYNLPSSSIITTKIYVDGNIVNQTTTNNGILSYLLIP